MQHRELRTGHRPLRSTALRVLAAISVVAATLVWTATPAAAATVGVSKSVSPSTVEPGESVIYTITLTCSAVGEPQGCENYTVSDTFPDEFVADVVPGTFHHDAGASDTVPAGGTVFSSLISTTYDYSYDDATGAFTLTIPALDPAITPLNLEIGMTLPEGTDVEDGTVVNNEACTDADNNVSGQQCDDVDVTVDVPFDADITSSKSWDPSSVLAQSGAATTITLGVANRSSNSVDPLALVVTDQTTGDPDGPPPDPWNLFDLTGLGDVTYPDGADQVQVLYCEAPYATQCDAANPAEWTGGAQQTGSPISIDGGVDPAGVTGVQFVFSNSGGAELPYDPDGGSVEVEMTLRDDERDGDGAIEPVTTLDVDNTASSAVLVDGDGGCAPTPCLMPGPDATDDIQVVPNLPEVTTDKEWFSDPDHDLVNDTGPAMAFTGWPIALTVDVTNDSPFDVESMGITEPTGGSDPFAVIEVDEIYLTFPAGAATADLTIDCAAPDADVILTGLTDPAGPFVRPDDFDCDVQGVELEFLGAGGAATIEDDTGSLTMWGTLKAPASAGTYRNCATGEVVNDGDGAGSATSEDCDDLDVENPEPPDGPGTKSASQDELPPDTPLDFNVRFTNTANHPLVGLIFSDPAGDPPAAPFSPFDVIRMTDLTASCTGGLTTQTYLVETWDPLVRVDSTTATAQQFEDAIGWQVIVPEIVPIGTTCTVTAEVMRRDGVDNDVTLSNCVEVSDVFGPIMRGDGSDSVTCSTDVVTAPPSSAANLGKFIDPGTLPMPTPGLDPPEAEIKLRVSNTGNTHLTDLQVIDRDDDGADDDFFDNFDFVRFDGVSFPPGADRVQLDVCTTGCATDTWITGTPTASTTPALPGVSAGDVRGIRVTFTSSDPHNGFANLVPGSNFPASGPCEDASVCFTVTPRSTNRTTGEPVDGTYENTTQGNGTGPAGPFTIPDVVADLDVEEGTAGLDVDKQVVGAAVIAPGQTALFELSTTNTGTAALTDLVVTDPVPADLVFDETGVGGQPYAIVGFDVPAGTSPPGPVEFETITDSNGKVTLLRWRFPGRFEVGSEVRIRVGMKIAGGLSAGDTVDNVMGSGSGAGDDFECTDAPPDGDTGGDPWELDHVCTDGAEITTSAGTAFEARKWVAGNPNLGLYNDDTSAFVALDDPSCPTLQSDGATYTRYPCVALVNPGEDYDYLIRVNNAGTFDGLEVRILDMLPRPGDTGVIDPAARDTEWNTPPRMTAAPVVSAPQGPDSTVTSYTTLADPCTTELDQSPVTCPAGDWTSAFNADATGFQSIIAFSGAEPFAPGSSIDLTWSMSTPATLDPVGHPSIAWNSFAHNELYEDPSTGPERLLPAEPLKVGVGMLFGALEVEKLLEVGQGATADAGPFSLAYSCTVVPDDGDPVEVLSGTGQFSPDAPFVLQGIPAEARCSVWETDPGTATSSNPVSDPITVVVPAGETSTEITAETAITNTWPSPEPPTPTPSPGPDAGPDSAGRAPQSLAYTGGGLGLVAVALALMFAGVTARRAGSERTAREV